LKLDDPFLWIAPWENTGWRPVRLPNDVKKTSYFDQRVATWRKTAGKLCLTRSVDRTDDKFPSRRPSLYTISKGDESTELALFEAHWADFDQRGRIVAAAGGRILEGKLDRHHGLRWRQLAAFQDEQPELVKTPISAARW